jgi:hypothetical protein
MTLAFCLVAKRAPIADAAGSITNTSVVLGTTTAGAVTTATIGFKPQAAIPSGGTVRITFPGAPSAYTLSPTAISGTGFATGTVFTVQSLLSTTITVAATNPAGGFLTTGGTALTLTLNGVRLPPNATTGTLGVLDALTTVDAQSATLDTISGSLAFPQLTTATFTGMSISLSSITKGATGIMTVGFTTVNAIPANGVVLVTMPANYTATTGSQVVALAGFTPATASVTGQLLTITNGSTAVPASTAVSFTVSDITNPATAGSGASFALRTRTATVSGQVTYDIDAGTVTGPAILNATLSGSSITLANRTAGTATTATIQFTPDDAWPAGGIAKVTFPAAFTFGSPMSASIIGANGSIQTPTVSGQVVTLTRSGGTDTAAGTAVTVALTGVITPNASGAVTYANSSIQLLQADGTSVVGTSTSVSSNQSISAGSLTTEGVTASPNTAGSLATVRVAFTVSNPVPANGTIAITFANDYVLTSATLGAATARTNAGTTIALSPAFAVNPVTSTVTLTLGTTETAPAGSLVVVTVAAVRLPQVAGRTVGSSPRFSITTRNATAVLIDSGTASDASTVASGALVAPSVTLTSRTTEPANEAGKPVKVTASFTLSPQNALAVGGSVKITFPTSPAPFGLSTISVETTTLTINGSSFAVPGLFTVSPYFSAPDVELNFAGLNNGPLAAGTTVAITMTGITNPAFSSVSVGTPSGLQSTWQITTRTPTTAGILPIDTATITTGPVIIPAPLGGPDASPSGVSASIGLPRLSFATGQAGVSERATVAMKLTNPLSGPSLIQTSGSGADVALEVSQAGTALLNVGFTTTRELSSGTTITVTLPSDASSATADGAFVLGMTTDDALTPVSSLPTNRATFTHSAWTAGQTSVTATTTLNELIGSGTRVVISVGRIRLPRTAGTPQIRLSVSGGSPDVTLSTSLTYPGQIRVTFPTEGFDLTGTSLTGGGTTTVTSSSGATSNGTFVLSRPGGSTRELVLTYLGNATFSTTGELPTGAVVSIPIDGVRLPSTVPTANTVGTYGTTGITGTTGNFTVQTEYVLSGTSYIGDRSSSVGAATVVPANVTAVTLGASPAVTGRVAAFTVAFTIGASGDVPACTASVITLADNGPVNAAATVAGRTSGCGSITLTLPSSATMPGTPIPASAVTIAAGAGNPVTVSAIAVNGHQIRVPSPVALSSGQTVTVTISASAGITTPTTGGTYTAQVQTSSAPFNVLSTPATIASGADLVTVSPSGSSIAGQPATGLIVTFKTGAGASLVANTTTITLTFPQVFSLPASISGVHIAVNGIAIPDTSVTPFPVPGGSAITVTSPVSVEAGSDAVVSFWQNANLVWPTVSGALQILVQTSSAPVNVGGTLNVLPRAPIGLQVLLPGETVAPNTLTGKTGTPTLSAGSPATVVIRAYDQYFNTATTGTGANATVAYTYSDTQTTLPSGVSTLNRLSLVAGQGSLTFTPRLPGAFTLTATDLAETGALTPAAQSVSVGVGTPARIMVLLPGETLAPGTATGIAGTSSLSASQGGSVTVPLTIYVTDAAFNLATTTAPATITMTDGVTPRTVNLTNGVGSITLTLPFGTTTLTLGTAPSSPVTGSRAVSVTETVVTPPTTGGGSQTTPAPATTPAPITTPAPTATPVATAPVATPLPSPVAESPIPAPTPLVIATPEPTTTTTIIETTAEPNPSAGLPDATPSPVPMEPTNPPVPTVTQSTDDAKQTPVPTASPVPTRSKPADQPDRPRTILDRNVRASDLAPFVIDTQVTITGARFSFGASAKTLLPEGTTADATTLLPELVLGMPDVKPLPRGTTPVAAFQAVARTETGGTYPLPAQHLIEVTVTDGMIQGSDARDLEPSRIYAFELHNGTWRPTLTRLDEKTGTLRITANDAMVMLVSFAPDTIRPDADYPIGMDANGEPTGTFFTQTNGRDPGATPLGFGVRDTTDGPALYSEFERFGGVDELGYPIAQQATFKGFAIQITQRAVLQWVPNAEGTDGQAVRLNVMDELASSGYDDYLYTQLQVPKTFSNEGDEGLSYGEVQERHLKFLDNNLLTKRAYLETPNAISEYGLPTAYEEFEDVYVVRTQRAVLQLWKVSRPWAQAGEITIMGAGELLKDVSLVAASEGNAPPVPVTVFTPTLPPPTG